MPHFPLMHLIASQPGGSAPLPAHQLYLLGGIVLGAAMLLVILLVISAARRSSMRRLHRPPSTPAPHPLHKHEVDPWRESARRLDLDSDD